MAALVISLIFFCLAAAMSLSLMTYSELYGTNDHRDHTPNIRVHHEPLADEYEQQIRLEQEDK